MFPLSHLTELLSITPNVSFSKTGSPNTGLISNLSFLVDNSSTIVKSFSPANVKINLFPFSLSIVSLLVKKVLLGKYKG